MRDTWSPMDVHWQINIEKDYNRSLCINTVVTLLYGLLQTTTTNCFSLKLETIN